MSTTHSHIDFVLPILVSQQSQRQKYVFDLIFTGLIGIDYQLYFDAPPAKHLSYGTTSGAISVFCHSYLQEETIKHPTFDTIVSDGLSFPFGTEEKYSFPFDLFSTVFYFVSRHEEYESNDLDAHGRYKAENSWLTQNGWLKTPIVNYLVELLKQKITTVFGIDFPAENTFSIEPTIDIDNAYAFYGRENSLLPSILKSILKGDFAAAKQKWVAKANKNIDPYNTHQQIISYSTHKNWKPKVFFLMKTGGRNSISSLEATKEVVLKYQAAGITIGIHPSYNSSSKSLGQEKKLLEQGTKQDVNLSRFHFIQSVLPASYHSLLGHAISEDYSMGYASQNGFRAGICQPYYWFDLTQNKVTELQIIPFCFMDATFIFNLGQSPETAYQEIKTLVQTVKKYNGHLSFIFHNESLSDTGVYSGWKNVWDKLFAELK